MLDAVRSEVDPRAIVDPSLADRRLAEAGAAAAAAGSDRTAVPIPDAGPAVLDAPLHALGIGSLLAAYRSGATDPAAVCDALAARAASHPSGRDSVLALVDPTAAAEDSACRWASGTARPLEGIPFGVKAIIDLAGSAVTCGSHLTGARTATEDAAVVARLRAAGAIPFAMLATTEFAVGGPDNPRHGRVSNPYDRSRWTGGSSTGSGAALAARLLPLALGTDTGGSIRVPSAWCGLTGLKPTRERVPREGVATLSHTLDHVGPMARSAADLALAFPVMAASPPVTPRPLTGMRFGVAGGWFREAVSREVLAAFDAAVDTIAAHGAEIVMLDVPDIAPFHAMGWDVLRAELAALYGPYASRRAEMDDALLVRLDAGLAVTGPAYVRALQGRVEAQDAILAAMADVDLMLTPGLGGTAGHLATRTVTVDGVEHGFQDIISRNTMIFDFTGFPALMLPMGRGADGLPLALQMVGRPGADEACIAAAASFQNVTDTHRMSPDDV